MAKVIQITHTIDIKDDHFLTALDDEGYIYQKRNNGEWTLIEDPIT